MEQSSRALQIKQDKLALRKFVENFHWASHLSDAEAQSNLYNGIVEIVYETGQHAANGLLVTKNGYVVTNYHCISDMADKPLMIRTSNKTWHRIIKICGYNASSDIALIKADMGGPAEAHQYRFVLRNDLTHKFPIDLLVRWYGKLKKKAGFVERPRFTVLEKTFSLNKINYDVKNQIPLELKTRGGDSGGLVVTERSEIYGLLTAGTEISVYSRFSKTPLSTKIASTCTFWFEALNIIQKVIGDQPAQGEKNEKDS